MSLVNFSWTDENGLNAKIERWNALKQLFPEIRRRELTEIYNRGKSSGGTPVSTEATRPGGVHGELMESLTYFGGDEVGYSKDYAPHVEYGHRTRGNGYVEGQRYFEANLKAQEPIYREHLIQILEE